MSLPRYDWKIPETDPAANRRLAAATGLSEPVAGLLLSRRLTPADDPGEALRFLEASLRGMLPPMTMPGVEEATRKILGAIEEKGRIVVFGDFDCDGTVATAILTDILRSLGADVTPFIPDRSDGYGLTEGAVTRCLAETPSLLVTVDCGMGAGDALRRFLETGCKVIVSDHHTPGAPLPAACTVVSTFNEGVPEPCRDLCGAGVAYKIASGVISSLYPAPDRTGRERLYGWLDALAIATVADVVPLLGENRLYVHEGLKVINKRPRPGIRALAEATGASHRPLTSEHLAYVLAPHINAAGRMGSAKEALRLLLATDADDAKAAANGLREFNVQRRKEEQKVLEEVDKRLATPGFFDPGKDGAIVIEGKGWHPGTIGIAAARLCDAFRRPVIVISLDGETGRGSIRAPEGYNAYRALSACADHLIHFGGHENAAGLAIEKERIEPFRRAFSDECFRQVHGPAIRPSLEIGGQIGFGDIDEKLLESIGRLEPYGMGNPSPCWVLSDVEVKATRMGRDGNHLRLDARREDGVHLKCVCFGAGDLVPSFKPGTRWDIAGSLAVNEFRGDREIELMMIDARPSVGAPSGASSPCPRS